MRKISDRAYKTTKVFSLISPVEFKTNQMKRTKKMKVNSHMKTDQKYKDVQCNRSLGIIFSINNTMIMIQLWKAMIIL